MATHGQTDDRAARTGKSYDWSSDHVLVKSTLDLSDGRVTLEDRLKPGFHLARHHHRWMIEIF
jgi:hypothetical protein